MRIFIIISFLFFLNISFASDFDHNHSIWNQLLEKYVHMNEEQVSSFVDYSSFLANEIELDKYLKLLSEVNKDVYDNWTKSQQLSFLINAYNAFTIKLILTEYPDINSIRNITPFFRSPWKIEFFELFGKKRHLDWLEHEVIREKGVFDEPRIHFAVNCASIGCPMLLNQAYIYSLLENQLEFVTKQFLSDKSRNYFDENRNRLYISRIFNWYKEDFELGFRNTFSVEEFLSLYSEELSHDYNSCQIIKNISYNRLSYTSYNWNLNNK